MEKQPINIAEFNNFMELIDDIVPRNSGYYRHLMAKEQATGNVTNSHYEVGSDTGDLVDSMDSNHHQYVTLALFSSSKSRTKSAIKATSGLYVDLDDDLFNGSGRIGLDLVDDALKKAKLPAPSIYVHTGGGWHLYWLFKDLYYFNNDEDITRYESVIASIIDSLTLIGADSKAKDAGRLLRLPGTFNIKAKYGVTGRGVYIINTYQDRYTLSDFNKLKTVKSLPEEYKPTNNRDKQQPIKQVIKIEPTQPNKQPVAINQPLTRPEDFPMSLIGDIIADAQDNLQKRTNQARYMSEVNQLVIVDLLINFIGLSRNHYTFEDGTTGQYVQLGSRNHYLWALSRRGVTEDHLSIINKTLILPSLSHKEFKNAVRVGRELQIPKITAMIGDLGLTLTEQQVMGALRVDYETVLDKHEKVVSTRINQLITESNHSIILASKGKKANVLADELGISVRRVNQLKKQKGVNYRMNNQERLQEIRDMYKDVEKTGRIALSELYEDYQVAGEVLDRIIRNQSLIHSLRVPLTQEQREDIKIMAESIIAKVEFITSQLEAYEEFILDDSEFFKSGKIKKTVLLDKVAKLKQSVQLITV